MINTCIRRGFFILTGLYSGGLIEVRQAGGDGGGGNGGCGGDGSRLDSWRVRRFGTRGREGRDKDLRDNR